MNNFTGLNLYLVVYKIKIINSISNLTKIKCNSALLDLT